MSAILDKLLKGQKVEWKSLGQVSNLSRGRVMSKQYLTENIGDYPVYSSQTANNGQIGKIDSFDYDGEYVSWTTDGANAGTVFYRNGKFSITNVCGLIKIKNISELNYKFLFYWLSTQAKHYVYSGMGNPKLMSNQIEKIPIPIPPFDVQAEIVRILDAFTAVTAELTQELAKEKILREKQYQYYRDKLLTFSDNEIIWKSLGDLVLPTQNIKWKETLSSYRYIDLSSVDKVNNNIGETLEISSKNAPSRAQKIVKEADIIFATTRPTQMRVAIIPKQFNEQIASTGYCILRANQEEVIPKWIYYNLSLARFKAYLEENQSGVAYPAISDGLVKEFMIPVPSLKEQKRIVEILDKFETLTHSITQGLPKEITLREQQYEYYREQLLDFAKN